MRNGWSVRGAVIAVVAVFGGMLFPGTAQALCHGPVGSNENTIGVGGNPVASTPEFHLTWCVNITGQPTGGLPGVSVDCISATCPNLQGTWIMIGPSSGSIDSITVNYSLDGQPRSHTIPLPPTGGAEEQCVFYIGRAVNNPGGCLLFYNHGL